MRRAASLFMLPAMLAVLTAAPGLPGPLQRAALAQQADAVPSLPALQDALSAAPSAPTPLPGPGDPIPADTEERSDPVLADIDCATAIAGIAARTRVSEGLLLAIAQLESGMSRWAVSGGGERQAFDARDKAVAALQALQAADVAPIRIGCMGLDVADDAGPFPQPETAFNARRNVEAAAARLLRLQRQSGTWAAAIGGFRGDDDPAVREHYRCTVLQELARLRGQQPTACPEPAMAETADREPALPGMAVPRGPRVVPLDYGLRAIPRGTGDGPVIVRGLDGLRQLNRGLSPEAAGERPALAPGDARVEVFRSQPTIAGAAAGRTPPAPADRAAIAPRGPGGSGTRVQHVTDTEGSGTTVRGVR